MFCLVSWNRIDMGMKWKLQIKLESEIGTGKRHDDICEGQR